MGTVLGLFRADVGSSGEHFGTLRRSLFFVCFSFGDWAGVEVWWACECMCQLLFEPWLYFIVFATDDAFSDPAGNGNIDNAYQ